MQGEPRADREEIAAEVRRFIADEALTDGFEAPPDDSYPLLTSGLLDSFDLVALVSALQDRFQVEFPPGDLAPSDLETVSAICALVERSQAERR